MEAAGVQDAFHLTCQPQSLDAPPLSAGVKVSLSGDDLSLLLSSLCDWESAPRQCAAALAPHLTALTTPDHEEFAVLSQSDLLSHQKQDPVVSRVVHYVERRSRQSRRERYNESQQTLRVLKQWDKFTLLDVILNRVVKDPLTKRRRFLFVVPQSLIPEVLSGIHDHAGHQC